MTSLQCGILASIDKGQNLSVVLLNAHLLHKDNILV